MKKPKKPNGFRIKAGTVLGQSYLNRSSNLPQIVGFVFGLFVAFIIIKLLGVL